MMEQAVFVRLRAIPPVGQTQFDGKPSPVENLEVIQEAAERVADSWKRAGYRVEWEGNDG